MPGLRASCRHIRVPPCHSPTANPMLGRLPLEGGQAAAPDARGAATRWEKHANFDMKTMSSLCIRTNRLAPVYRIRA